MNMVTYWRGEGVTVSALKAEVIKLATESPNNLRDCIYSTHSGTPVCIVGQAIFNITGEIVHNDEWFGQIDGSNQWITALGGEPYEEDHGFSTEEYRAFRFVADVQNHQDKGNSWGEALVYAQTR